MSIYRILAVASALVATSACQYNNADLNYDELHKYCSQEWKPDLGTSLPDLAMPPPAKCAAAKGLTGDAIICVDFSSTADQILGSSLPQVLNGWTFGKDAMNNDCWQIAGGKLQVKNFGTFVGTCSFTMPLTDLAAAANQKYQSVTLAVVQRVDLNASALPPQSAKSMLGLDDPSRLLTTTTDKTPRQQQVYTLTRSDLAGVPGVGTNFQPLFKLSSAAVAPGNTGWQIESIAVMGNP